MNVAVVLNSVSRRNGGIFEAERQLHATIKSDPGVVTRVFGVRDRYTDEDRSAWGSIPVTDIRSYGPAKFALVPSLHRAIDEFQAHIVYIAGIWTDHCRVAGNWAKAKKKSYIVTPHGMLDEWALRNSRWVKRLVGKAYQDRLLESAGCLRALCAQEADAIRRYGLKNPIAVIPNGIDIPDVPPHVSESSPFPGQKNVMLYLGRLHPKKGLVPFLDAWAETRRASDFARDWVLAIAGWDQDGHEYELRRRAAALGLEHHVLFLGPQFGDDKARCYYHCDAFVLPSFSEGLPMAVLEAWAYAKPVVMTGECNLPEGFAASAASRLSHSKASIAEELNTFFALSDENRLEMGRKGRELVRERFSWQDAARKVVEVYRWLAEGSPQPACIAGN